MPKHGMPKGVVSQAESSSHLTENDRLVQEQLRQDMLDTLGLQRSMHIRSNDTGKNVSSAAQVAPNVLNAQRKCNIPQGGRFNRLFTSNSEQISGWDQYVGANKVTQPEIPGLSGGFFSLDGQAHRTKLLQGISGNMVNPGLRASHGNPIKKHGDSLAAAKPSPKKKNKDQSRRGDIVGISHGSGQESSASPPKTRRRVMVKDDDSNPIWNKNELRAGQIKTIQSGLTRNVVPTNLVKKPKRAKSPDKSSSRSRSSAKERERLPVASHDWGTLEDLVNQTDFVNFHTSILNPKSVPLVSVSSDTHLRPEQISNLDSFRKSTSKSGLPARDTFSQPELGHSLNGASSKRAVVPQPAVAINPSDKQSAGRQATSGGLTAPQNLGDNVTSGEEEFESRAWQLFSSADESIKRSIEEDGAIKFLKSEIHRIVDSHQALAPETIKSMAIMLNQSLCDRIIKLYNELTTDVGPKQAISSALTRSPKHFALVDVSEDKSTRKRDSVALPRVPPKIYTRESLLTLSKRLPAKDTESQPVVPQPGRPSTACTVLVSNIEHWQLFWELFRDHARDIVSAVKHEHFGKVYFRVSFRKSSAARKAVVESVEKLESMAKMLTRNEFLRHSLSDIEIDIDTQMARGIPLEESKSPKDRPKIVHGQLDLLSKEINAGSLWLIFRPSPKSVSAATGCLKHGLINISKFSTHEDAARALVHAREEGYGDRINWYVAAPEFCQTDSNTKETCTNLYKQLKDTLEDSLRVKAACEYHESEWKPVGPVPSHAFPAGTSSTLAGATNFYGVDTWVDRSAAIRSEASKFPNLAISQEAALKAAFRESPIQGTTQWRSVKAEPGSQARRKPAVGLSGSRYATKVSGQSIIDMSEAQSEGLDYARLMHSAKISKPPQPYERGLSKQEK